MADWLGTTSKRKKLSSNQTRGVSTEIPFFIEPTKLSRDHFGGKIFFQSSHHQKNILHYEVFYIILRKTRYVFIVQQVSRTIHKKQQSREPGVLQHRR
jgi:hypothetical protein